MRTLPLLVLFLTVAATGVLSAPAHAQTLSSLSIEQISSSRIGTWTLIRADGSSISSASPDIDTRKYTAGVSTFGAHVLRVEPTAGMVAKISVYRGGELIKETDSSQYTFTLYPNENYRFVIQYRTMNVGALGIISELQGVIFRIKSSDGRTYRGKTPWAKNDLPIGKYTIYSNAARGCFVPAPVNAEVKMEERTVVTITQMCEGATDDITVVRIRPSKRTIHNNVLVREARRR